MFNSKKSSETILETSRSTRPLGDNIILRGPRLDTYIRPYSPSTGVIGYSSDFSVPNELRNFTAFPFMTGDENVQSLMLQRPQVHRSLQHSVVQIESDIMDKKGRCAFKRYGSGCLISSSYVFTCSHSFDLNDMPEYKIGVIRVRNFQDIVSVACIVDISQVLSTVDEKMLITAPDSQQWMMGEEENNSLDFAVLKLVVPFCHTMQELVAIPEIPSWSPSTPLLALGFPVRLDSNVLAASDYFTHEVYNGVRKWGLDDPDPVFEKFLDSTFANLWQGNAVACFGSPTHISDIGFGYYGLSTISAIFGCSGGPIVNPRRPTELIGLTLGSWPGSDHTIFLDTQTPAVKSLYQFFRSLI